MKQENEKHPRPPACSFTHYAQGTVGWRETYKMISSLTNILALNNNIKNGFQKSSNTISCFSILKFGLKTNDLVKTREEEDFEKCYSQLQ